MNIEHGLLISVFSTDQQSKSSCTAAVFPSRSMAKATRMQSDIYLVGPLKEEFTGSKLPSVHDVLGVYFHQLKVTSKTKHEAAKETIQKLSVYCSRARIPVRDERKAISKLEDLVTIWENLKKNRHRKTETQKKNEDAFTADFTNLFDVSHGNALQMIDIQEDREFLIAQQQPGRRGSMAGMDKKLEKKENEKKKRAELLRKRKIASEETKRNMLETAVLETTSSSSAAEESEKSEDEEDVRGPSTSVCGTPCHQKRGRKKICTPEVLDSLD